MTVLLLLLLLLLLMMMMIQSVSFVADLNAAAVTECRADAGCLCSKFCCSGERFEKHSVVLCTSLLLGLFVPIYSNNEGK